LECGAPVPLWFSARMLYFCPVIILLSVIQVLSEIQSEAGASHSRLFHNHKEPKIQNPRHNGG
jgi:hypothetical protein